MKTLFTTALILISFATFAQGYDKFKDLGFTVSSETKTYIIYDKEIDSVLVQIYQNKKTSKYDVYIFSSDDDKIYQVTQSKQFDQIKKIVVKSRNKKKQRTCKTQIKELYLHRCLTDASIKNKT